MGGQMRHLFSGMFAIDLTGQEEVKYRSVHFGVTMDQLAEAAEQTNNQSVNGLRLKLRTWAISATNSGRLSCKKTSGAKQQVFQVKWFGNISVSARKRYEFADMQVRRYKQDRDTSGRRIVFQLPA